MLECLLVSFTNTFHSRLIMLEFLNASFSDALGAMVAFAEGHTMLIVLMIYMLYRIKKSGQPIPE